MMGPISRCKACRGQIFVTTPEGLRCANRIRNTRHTWKEVGAVRVPKTWAAEDGGAQLSEPPTPLWRIVFDWIARRGAAHDDTIKLTGNYYPKSRCETCGLETLNDPRRHPVTAACVPERVECGEIAR